MSPKENSRNIVEINPTAQIISALVLAMQDLALTPKEQDAAAKDVNRIQNIMFFVLMMYKNQNTAIMIKALMQATRASKLSEAEIAELAARKDLVDIFSHALSPFKNSEK